MLRKDYRKLRAARRGSTGFCVQRELCRGTGTPAVPKPITILGHQEIITAIYVSRNHPKYNNIVPQKVPIPYPPVRKSSAICS